MKTDFSLVPIVKGYIKPFGLLVFGLMMVLFTIALEERMHGYATILVVLYLTPALVQVIVQRKKQLVLDDEGLVLTLGKRTTKEVKFAQIDYIDLDVPVMGMTFHFGTIVCYAHDGRTYRFKHVKNPHEMAHEASERLRWVKRQSM